MSDTPDIPPPPPLAERARQLWDRTVLLRSLAFLGAGSLWDVLTLTRIDRWTDQAFIAAYQLIFFATIVLDLRWSAADDPPWFVRRWPNLLRYGSQFALGSMLSAYTVFYFRGAASVRAFVYGLFLVVLLVANEFVTERLRAVPVRLAVLAFALFNGFVFALPIWTGWLIPAIVPALAAFGVTYLARRLAQPAHLAANEPIVGKLRALGPAVGVLVLTLGLVWANVLPPLPLSLQRVGVFRDVARTEDGVLLTGEKQGFFSPYRYDRTLHWQPGEYAWCFTAVFAPRGMDLEVVHHWEQFRPDEGWLTRDSLTLEVRGGRDGGFRTWSRKQHLEPGPWRVRITDPRGRELGRVHVDVVAGEPTRELRSWTVD